MPRRRLITGSGPMAPPMCAGDFFCCHKPFADFDFFFRQHLVVFDPLSGKMLNRSGTPQVRVVVLLSSVVFHHGAVGSGSKQHLGARASVGHLRLHDGE
jgi:hypothetical protein